MWVGSFMVGFFQRLILTFQLSENAIKLCFKLIFAMKGFSKLCCAAIVLLVISSFWIVLLYPSVSLSTGELKARGMYVDEHAFTVQVLSSAHVGVADPESMFTGTGTDTDTDKGNSMPISHKEFCRQVMLEGATSCSFYPSSYTATTTATSTATDVFKTETEMEMKGSAPSLIQLVLDCPTKPTSKEVTVLPLVYSYSSSVPTGTGTAAETGSGAAAAFFFAMRLNKAMQSVSLPWLSRRLVLLLIPVDCDKNNSIGDCDDSTGVEGGGGVRHSQLLEMWLNAYHTAPSVASAVSLTGEYDGSHYIHSEKLWRDMHVGLIREALVLDFTDWGSSSSSPASSNLNMDLRVVGAGGNLPNMDMVSSILTLIPSPGLQTYSGRDNYNSKGTSTAKGLSKSENGLPLWMDLFVNTFIPQSHRQAHKDRLRGLLSFSAAQLQGADGLHALFLARDVDAVTIRLHSTSTCTGTGTCTGRNTNHVDVDILLQQRIQLLLRAFSQLHESLHHSHTYYLLMAGGTAFVSLGEMILPLICATLPLFMLFYHLSAKEKVSLNAMAYALTGIAVDMTVLAMVLLLPWRWLSLCIGMGMGVGMGMDMDISTWRRGELLAITICIACIANSIRIVVTMRCLCLQGNNIKQESDQKQKQNKGDGNGDWDRDSASAAQCASLAGILFVLCMHAGGHTPVFAHPLGIMCSLAVWTMYMLSNQESVPTATTIAARSELESSSVFQSQSLPAHVHMHMPLSMWRRLSLITLAIVFSPAVHIALSCSFFSSSSFSFSSYIPMSISVPIPWHIPFTSLLQGWLVDHARGVGAGIGVGVGVAHCPSLTYVLLALCTMSDVALRLALR